MTLHPLTHRKPWLGAAAAGTAVGLFIGAASFSVGMIFPPEIWDSYADTIVTADAAFFADLLETLVYDATARHEFLDRVSGVLELPTRLMETLQRLDLALPIATRLFLAASAGALAGQHVFNTFQSGSFARPAVQHVDGPKLLSGRAARRMLQGAWYKRFNSVAEGIELVKGLVLPRQLESEHILLLGGTGAGKTTILQNMIASAASKNDQMLVLDVKGDMTAFLPVDPFALLSLEDERSARWIPGYDFTTTNDANELAIELIASTSDPAWSEGARQVLAAMIRYLQAKAKESRQPWTWNALFQLILLPIEELYYLIEPFDPVTATFIDITREGAQKSALSFYLVLLCNTLQPLSALSSMGKRGRPLSIRRWMVGKDARRALVVRQSQRIPKVSAMMSRLVLKVSADAAAERAATLNPVPVWFFLDELPQIGNAEAVPRLAAIGRSAGARLVVTVQSLSQLKDNYGENAAAHLLDNLTTKIVGRIPEGLTADEVLGWTGDRTVTYWNTTGRDADGRLRSEKVTADIPVVSRTFLSELGLAHSLDGKPIVRAMVLGQRDIAVLEWPVGTFPNRRPAQVRALKKRSVASRKNHTAVTAVPTMDH